jgi:hypothetical protein
MLPHRLLLSCPTCVRRCVRIPFGDDHGDMVWKTDMCRGSDNDVTIARGAHSRRLQSVPSQSSHKISSRRKISAICCRANIEARRVAVLMYDSSFSFAAMRILILVPSSDLHRDHLRPVHGSCMPSSTFQLGWVASIVRR